MIRRLAENDEQEVLSYLSKNPHFSVFLCGDIDSYGFEHEIFSIWAEFSHKKEIRCIFATYYDTLLIYSNEDTVDLKKLVHYLAKEKVEFKVITGRKELIEPLKKWYSFSVEHKNHLCILKKTHFHPIGLGGVIIQKAKFAHAQEIFDLFHSMPEFKGFDMRIEAVKKYIIEYEVYIAVENEAIVAVAICSSKSKTIANIGGICTHNEYRKKGYASKVVSALCKDLLSQGLDVTLSYDNPQAGSVYKKIGFKEAGQVLIDIL